MPLSIASSPATVDPWQGGASTIDSRANLTGACALLAVLFEAQSSTQAGAKTDIELNAQKLEELKQQLAEAVEQAKEAAEQSGFLGFLGKIFGSDIAKIAGAVAAIAATIASAGAGTPLLLMAASATLQAAAKAGAELGLDPKLCMALSFAAVAVGFAGGAGAGQAANALTNAARSVEVTAKITQGGAVVAGGALDYAAARYHADDLHHQADAAGYHASQTATQFSMDDAFALLERALRAERQETGTVSEIVQNNSDTQSALCSRI